MMYAITVDKDKHLHWSQVEDPVVKDDEVLLKVHAAALNRADLLQKAGQYPPPPGWPDRFGLEAAGEIVASDRFLQVSFMHSLYAFGVQLAHCAA